MSEQSAAADTPVRLTVWVSGRVQGVGFRWWTRARALELGLVGWAKNLPDGRVEVVCEGTRQACDSMLDRLGSGNTPGHVATRTHRFSDARGGIQTFTER